MTYRHIVKEQFGHIFFTIWIDPKSSTASRKKRKRKSSNPQHQQQERYLPVLCLSPYKVRPGKVREMWYREYNQSKKRNRLDTMKQLCYWYGSENGNGNGNDNKPDGTYTMVPMRNLIPYDEGQKKGYDKISESMEEKQWNDVKLTRYENLLTA